MNSEFEQTAFPATLRKVLDSEPSANPEIVYRRAHCEGRLTASVHGSHVHVTVSLGRWWAAWMNYTPSADELRRIAEWLLRAQRSAWNILIFAVFFTAAFTFIQIVAAFLPGGAAARVIGGR